MKRIVCGLAFATLALAGCGGNIRDVAPLPIYVPINTTVDLDFQISDPNWSGFVRRGTVTKIDDHTVRYTAPNTTGTDYFSVYSPQYRTYVLQQNVRVTN